MSLLLDTLNRRTPALWLEVAPPRGVNPAPLLKRLAAVAGRVDALNLTDNALARVKMSGLVFGAMVKEQLRLPVVLNFSCRDRNRFALKSDLLGACALGIDGVVAVTGDKIAPGESGGAKPVHDLDAMGLLGVIAALNRGDTGEGKAALKTLPNIVAGAVANPNRGDFEREVDLLRRKAEAGARFVITQPVFEAATARRFLERARQFGLQTVLGILPVKREAMANYLKDRVTDLSGAASHLGQFAGMAEGEVRRKSLEDNLSLMKSLARETAGFNIMSGGGPSLAIELALEFSRWRGENGD